MKSKTFSEYTHECVCQLERDGRFSTAHLYSNACHSFSVYLGKAVIHFNDITSNNLVSFERHLRHDGRRPNTVSTYMRMLRAIYNKGVNDGYARFVHNLFRNVYTGIDSSHKRALDRDQLNAIFYGTVKSNSLRRAQNAARSMYQLCGMPFVDLVHANFSTVRDGILSYSRHKTGTGISITVMDETLRTVRSLNLHHYDTRTSEGYRHYQSALRKFNDQINRLAHSLGLTVHISSYTFRHSWATTALHQHIPIEVISSALGHRSIKTTQIYLRGFDAHELGEVNKKLCEYIKTA